MISPYAPTANVTLYAKWTEATEPDVPAAEYIIRFNTTGGSAIQNQTVKEGSTLTLPKPKREGYEFVTWCTDILCTDAFTMANMPGYDVTLYAKWQKVEATFESDYLAAKDFTEFSDPALSILFPDFDGKTLRRVLTSDDVGTMGSTKYNLNANLTPKKDYQIKWFKTDSFTDIIGTQKSELYYSDNIFFATINDKNDRILEAFLIDIYVLNDYYYTYYDTPYDYHLAYKTEPLKKVRVIEGDYPAEVEVSSSYTFKQWTDNTGTAFNIKVKPTKDAALYASYEDVECDVDTRDGEGDSKVVYTPYDSIEFSDIYEKDDVVFLGLKAGDVLIMDETGKITKEAKSVTKDSAKTLTAVWGEFSTDRNFFFEYDNKSEGYSVTFANSRMPIDKKIFIPNSYNSIDVTAIPENAFINCSAVEIRVPSSVTSIAGGAFIGDGALESITLPFVKNSFSYIFTKTDTKAALSIKNVVVLGGTIADSAFYNNTTLLSITLEDGVQSVGT